MKNGVKKFIVGIDEVGRGPIAGPVSVCLFISEVDFNVKSIFPHQTIRDSKKTKKHIRQSINQTIRYLRKSKDMKIDWVIASKSAQYIDRHGISKSIDSCINQCIKTIYKKGYEIERAKVYLDGGLRIKHGNFDQETVIKGDEKIGHIAIASILAKVYRDTYMEKLSKTQPYFNWEVNAGYGTKSHYEAIKKHDISKHHRTTFIHLN